MTSLAAEGIPENCEVVRNNITAEQFSALLKEHDLSPEDIGFRSAVRSVQKIYIRESPEEYPSAPEIFQNHPNPFNAETIIPYRIIERGPAVLEIFNILGQKILELDQGVREPGMYSVSLHADRIASGIYIYRLRGTAYSRTKRFAFIR
jgi:hypothetical protein